MTDNFESSSASAPQLPEVQVQSGRTISSLWLIPMIAALIGAWLVYKYFSELGPTITITFETAAGLEADKTRIKYKDVDVGVVKRVIISSDLTTIRVTAVMDKNMTPYINEDSRFWVVRPRIGASGVSGLTTLVSGAYIAFDPGSGPAADSFVGLEEPPVTPADAPGIHLKLVSDNPSSMDVGSPVYFKMFKVGRVDSRHFDLSNNRLEFGVFINAPYDQLINSDTRFWNASGLDISIDSNGIKVRSESLEAILIGGITFDTIAITTPGVPVSDGAVFKLYEDYKSITESEYTEKQIFVMYFEDSVRGLLPDAPVQFRGVKIGQVREINLIYDSKLAEVRIPVIVEIEPERLKVVNETEHKDDDVKAERALDNLTLKGLRAQLETGSLLTGQLYVALDMHPDAAPAKILYEGVYPEFPTVPSQFNQLTGNISSILTTVNKLPLQEVMASVSKTLQGVDDLVNAGDTQAVPAQLGKLLSNLQTVSKKVDDELGKLSWSVRTTLKSGRDTLAGVAPDSPMYYELIRSLRELTKAAREVRVLADELERKPESLLTGKKANR